MKNIFKILTVSFLLLFCVTGRGIAQDTLSVSTPESVVFNPDPVRATMLAAVLPGLGQIYNKKYWKVPIVYVGFGAAAYAVGYTSSKHSQFIKAYQDFTDDIAETVSYRDVIQTDPALYDRLNYPDTYSPSLESQFRDALLTKVDYFRKYRDYSYIAVGLWYLITILDAHVDACLFNYDISDNLGVEVVPLANTCPNKTTGVDIGIRFTF